MKFIHIADVHASKDRYDVVSGVLNQIIDRVSKGDISGLLIAGDFWDSTITNTSASHFTDYLDLVKKIAEYTKVYFIYGTPSHEPAGSLEVFKLIPNVTVIGGVYSSNVKEKFGEETVDIIGIPELRMSFLEGKSLEEKLKRADEYYDIVIGANKNKQHKRIVMMHGLVAGMKLQNGTEIPGGPGVMTIDKLKQLNADYYALGHVHMPQEIEHGLNGGYSGSVAPINFGETHNACYWEFEL